MSPIIRNIEGEFWLYRKLKDGKIDEVWLGTDQGSMRRYLTEAANVFNLPMTAVKGALERRGWIKWGNDIRFSETEKHLAEKGSSRVDLREMGKANFRIDGGGRVVFRGDVLGKHQE